MRQAGYGLKLGERNRILSDCSPAAGTTLLGSALGLAGHSSAWKVNAACYCWQGTKEQLLHKITVEFLWAFGHTVLATMSLGFFLVSEPGAWPSDNFHE